MLYILWITVCSWSKQNLKRFLEQNSNIEINKLIEISPKLKKNSYLEPDLNHNKSIIHSYEDAFKIAKKALYTINQK